MTVTKVVVVCGDLSLSFSLSLPLSLSLCLPPQSIKDTAAHLQQLSDQRKERIHEAIRRQQELDALRLNFAKKAAVSNPAALPPPSPSLPPSSSIFIPKNASLTRTFPSLSRSLPKAFNNWMDNTMEDLQERDVCHSIEDVEQLQKELEEFKVGPLQEASTNYDELNGLVQAMADLGSTDNPYTTLTPTVSPCSSS